MSPDSSHRPTGMPSELQKRSRWFSQQVYAGIDVGNAGLFTGTRGQQIAGRFSMICARPFGYTARWRSIVATFDTALLLHQHTPGTLAGLDKYLHDRTGGMIGSLSHLIRGAALQAILTGTEKITKNVLESIALDHAAEQQAAQNNSQGGSPRGRQQR
jgi:hypothetical protein